MTDLLNNLYRRSRSDDPFVALPALIRLKEIIEGPNPTTDTGFRSYGNELLPYGKGRLFLPAATNYCTNPSMEVWTAGDTALPDGWSSSGQTITGTPVISKVAGRNGGYALRWQYTGVAGDAGGKTVRIYALSASGTFASGDIATASAYIKGSCPRQTTIVVRSRTSADVAVASYASTAISLSSSYVRASVTTTALGATTDRCRLSLEVDGVVEGDVIDLIFDDLLLEKSAVLTPYGDGSYPGWSWSGTAHASTSARAANVLVFPGIAATVGQTGAFGGRATPLFASTSSVSAYAASIGVYGASVAGGVLFYPPNGIRAYMGTYSASTDAYGIGETQTVIQRWDAAGVYLTHNGTAKAAGAAPTVGGASTTIRLGHRPDSSSYPFYGYVGPWFYSPSKPTDAETATLSAMLTAGDVMGVLWKLKQANCHNALFLPLLQDAKSYIVP